MDLIKKLNEGKAQVLSLVKDTALKNQDAYCMFAIDTSGSMSSLFGQGWVQKLTERLLPIAMAFDDNGAMEMFEFSNRTKRVPTEVTSANIVDFVKNNVRPDFGGTNYAPAVQAIVDDYKAKLAKGGTRLPAFAAVITDGQCGDDRETTRAMIEASKLGIHFVFVGLGRKGQFPFLEKLDDLAGRFIDNATFFSVDTNDIDRMTDENFYKAMLKEFPQYVADAKTKGLID